MEILDLKEAKPASYPVWPIGLSPAASALNSDAIWQRIEAYTAHRWTDREAVWVVEGPGCFEPNLTPATITGMDLWQSDIWQPVTLAPSPLGGLVLPSVGPYRFTADVGGGTVPVIVNEAFRRLAEYLREVGNECVPGAQETSIDLGGALSTREVRSPQWIARAMDQSGAADLLRPYRRA